MSECQEFWGYKDKDGYGITWLMGAAKRAHRVVYAQAHGPIPEGMQVNHLCNNPPCVNLEHLVLGTPAENNEYCKQCGRGNIVPLPGESNGMHKLTETEVLEIRGLYQKGKRGHGVYVLAKRFGVSSAQIHDIVMRKAWKHI